MTVIKNLQIRFKNGVYMLLLGGVFLSCSTNAEAPLDIRVALVIGNAAYKNVPALANATNDARSMATVLRKLGFSVVEVVDGSKDQMSKSIDQLQLKLKGRQAVAMLYYAGHGLQLDWHNFMVPVDAKLDEASDVPKQTIDIENVINVLKKSGTRMNIIVLDACRDNPFAEKASGKGLAQLDAPPGTYLAFATSPGNVAEDGDVSEGNGLFTQFLLKELQKPASIENVFKRVRLQVRQKSQGRQIPWDSSSLEEEFAFNDGAKYTFNPADLIKEAKEKQEKLKADAEAAKQRELEIARQIEQERVRLAEEQKQREMDVEAQRKREIEIAKQQELERRRLAEAQKIKEQLVRQKAEAESKERERQLVLAAEEQKRLALESEKARSRIEAETKEREKLLAIAAAAEKRRAQEAVKALEQAKLTEVQRLQDLEQGKDQAELEARLKKETSEKQFDVQKTEWDKIKDSQNVSDFYAFLNRYPSGFITEQATAAIERLQIAKISSQADKTGMVQPVSRVRYRVGDSYTYVRRNNLTGAEMKRFTRVVTKIENGLVYISNDGAEEVRTIDGANVRIVSSNSSFKYDPPKFEVPTDEIVVGKKWTGAYIETEINSNRKFFREDRFTVLAQEAISTPAGVFNTFKIEDSSVNQFGAKASLIYWIEPGYGLPIKNIRKVVNAQNTTVISETNELVSRKIAN